jgi:uncharacterized protein
MRVFITGGTGLIGRSLCGRLRLRGDEPVILTRDASKARRDPELTPFRIVQGDPNTPGNWFSEVDGSDAVVNLAGHNIFAQRWSPAVKQAIRDSRVFATQNVVAAIAKSKNPPRVLVQGSAIGYYGPHGDETLSEDDPPGTDFMATVCREWEAAAEPAETQGLRVARIRTGIVLARDEGALGAMTPLFKWGPGVPIGGGGSLLNPGRGRQWMSWIHLDDIVGLLLLAIDHPEAYGPINATTPVRNAEFAKSLSQVLWKPSAPWRLYVPIGPPDFVLNLILGEVAHAVTSGQYVLPHKALALGYSFQYPTLSEALRALFSTPRREAAPHPSPGER